MALLSVRFMTDVQSVNAWRYTSQAEFYEGDACDVYFQIVDASVVGTEYGPSGRRYIPAAAATLQVVAENVEDARKVTRFASNPFPDDRSIWKLALTATDALAGTVTLRFILTEGVKVTHFVMNGALRLHNYGNT